MCPCNKKKLKIETTKFFVLQFLFSGYIQNSILKNSTPWFETFS